MGPVQVQVTGVARHLGRVLAGWAPVRAPYAGLREPLAGAEQRLNPSSGGPAGASAERWRRVRETTGDPVECAVAVNDLLAAVLGGWRLVPVEEGRWQVALLPAERVDPGELAAAQALALLVEAGGWSRLGRCTHPGCTAVLLDSTSGGNRRACRAHHRTR